MIFNPNSTANELILARNCMTEKINKGELDVIIVTATHCVGVNFFERCLVVVATPFKDWFDYIQICGRSEREDFKRDQNVVYISTANTTKNGIEDMLYNKWYEKKSGK